MTNKDLNGLVLTGGGARGAYQAGAIKASVEIAASLGIAQPFPILCGMSAGSINVAGLASYAQNMAVAAGNLVGVWGQVTSDQVYQVGVGTMVSKAVSWLAQLGSGGLYQPREAEALLNTSPLRELLSRTIPVEGIERNIKSGACQGVAITAIGYDDGISHTFFQTHKPLQPWHRVRRTSEEASINLDHVMASTAIPILFPPVQVGSFYYGDGSLRNHAPLSPAIKMGATKLIVLGARNEDWEREEPLVGYPSAGRIMSVLFNSIFLDAVDVDLERLTRINHTVESLGYFHGVKLKDVKVYMVRPSKDIATIALEEAHTMPSSIRYMLRGLGTPEETSGLISYLLFEPGYLQRLIELGYHDVMAQKESFAQFLTL